MQMQATKIHHGGCPLINYSRNADLKLSKKTAVNAKKLLFETVMIPNQEMLLKINEGIRGFELAVKEQLHPKRDPSETTRRALTQVLEDRRKKNIPRTKIESIIEHCLKYSKEFIKECFPELNR